MLGCCTSLHGFTTKPYHNISHQLSLQHLHQIRRHCERPRVRCVAQVRCAKSKRPDETRCHYLEIFFSVFSKVQPALQPVFYDFACAFHLRRLSDQLLLIPEFGSSGKNSHSFLCKHQASVHTVSPCILSLMSLLVHNALDSSL